MILEAFARYLESKNLGEVGVDLFCYYMPPKVPRGIMVMTPNDGILIDPELKGYYQDIFPVMIRAENINLLNNLSERVLKEMDARDFEVDGVYFNFIRAVTFPSIYPQNNGGSFEAGFVVEFSCYFSCE
ncbi:minor capsid protein (plasmid) [Moellerella wisconsensis]|uniref:phage tail terminator protein n=1 Tax=Moellerella wisconsensis TaxID=158849 RepID=UPI0025B0B182|nr:minor capsid protein [Moellerella wisconsensis]WJW83867.1 minor capsid protein [Moellerella wisconsensis]